MDVPTLDKVSGYNLYIGGFISLRRPKALANCRITHIVSVLDWKFDDSSPLLKGYHHLHIPVDDVEDENLIQWFARSNHFIDEGLCHWRNEAGRESAADHDGEADDWQNTAKGSGVLIHCAMGKSRSATILLAYLLRSSLLKFRSTPPPDPASDSAPIPPEPLTPDSALALVRQSHPLAEPNDGFMEQLRLYHEMGCPDADGRDIEKEPQYQRWLYSRRVKEAVDVGMAPDVGDLRFEDEQLPETRPRVVNHKGSQRRDVDIKCRKCRRLLVKSDYILDHQPTKASETCAHIYLQPLSWMRDALSNGALDGRLVCPNPKCKANVGKFAWQGIRCNCGGWETPGFCLARGRVDEVIGTSGSNNSGGAETAASRAMTKAQEGGGGRAGALPSSGIRLPPSMLRRGDEHL